MAKHPTPTVRETKAQILERSEREKVKFLRLQFTDILDRAENVRELQAQELHLLALGALEDLRLCFADGRGGVLGHGGREIVANFLHRPCVSSDVQGARR